MTARKVHRFSEGAALAGAPWEPLDEPYSGMAVRKEGEHWAALYDGRVVGFGFDTREAAEKRARHAKHEKEPGVDALEEGAALIEDAPEGVSAIIGEEGPEAVIPLDDPEAVEVMAEAIEEGGGGETGESEAAEAVAEAAEEVAEAASEVAEASAEVAESSAEVVSDLTDTLEQLADFAQEAEEAEEHAEEMEEHAEHSAATEEAREEEAPSEEISEAPKRDSAPRKRHWSQVTLGELFGSKR